ncbi:MAG: 23S rRNA (adenine(2503)-C(2))-methyltransferase RlmN [Clostridia bacterium]|nr:23S rRNA (adenine(2503)-C(2))-methyltransferase RlmN [Clostridia bacterium]
MENKIRLSGLFLNEIEDYMKSVGEGKFRAKQVHEWLMRGRDFSEMTNLSKALREKLSESCISQSIRILESIESKLDGTEKYLYELLDGNIIEGVRMRYHHGDTLCVSTQVGCRMGCAFCASTLDGCVRNLTADEMLGQILIVNRHITEKFGEGRIHNVVLMGSGEPMDNYDEVVRFLRLLNDPGGLNISLRNVSLSTCGLVPGIKKLAGEGMPVTLSISLHAPNDEVRKRLMPVANAYGMNELLNACREYIEKTGRRVIFEYAMVKDVNCSLENADELASRLRGMQCHVNLIPLNDVKERNLFTPGERVMKDFQKRLEDKHISVTRRREMGDDIQGACGQLRRSRLNENGLSK